MREAVVECDMPDPRKLPSLDSCQTNFLWAYKEVDLAPHPVVGLVFQVLVLKGVKINLIDGTG